MLIAVNVWIWPKIIQMTAPVSTVPIEETEENLESAHLFKQVEDMDVEEEVLEKESPPTSIEIKRKGDQFVLIYKGEEVGFQMNAATMESNFGEPNKIEKSPGLYHDTVDYVYDDVRFLFVPQTGDLTAIYFEQNRDILESEWMQGIFGKDMAAVSQSIKSGDERTILKLDVGQTVHVNLFEDWEGPVFNQAEYVLDEPEQDPFIKWHKSGGQLQAGDVFQMELGKYRNTRKSQVALSPVTFTMYSEEVYDKEAVGNELDEQRFSPPVHNSSHLTVTINPSTGTLMSGKEQVFFLDGQISPDAPVGTYRVTVRLEGQNVHYQTKEPVGHRFLLREMIADIVVVK